jgi:hypothetical protein
MQTHENPAQFLVNHLPRFQEELRHQNLPETSTLPSIIGVPMKECRTMWREAPHALAFYTNLLVHVRAAPSPPLSPSFFPGNISPTFFDSITTFAPFPPTPISIPSEAPEGEGLPSYETYVYRHTHTHTHTILAHHDMSSPSHFVAEHDSNTASLSFGNATHSPSHSSATVDRREGEILYVSLIHYSSYGVLDVDRFRALLLSFWNDDGECVRAWERERELTPFPTPQGAATSALCHSQGRSSPTVPRPWLRWRPSLASASFSAPPSGTTMCSTFTSCKQPHPPNTIIVNLCIYYLKN